MKDQRNESIPRCYRGGGGRRSGIASWRRRGARRSRSRPDIVGVGRRGRAHPERERRRRSWRKAVHRRGGRFAESCVDLVLALIGLGEGSGRFLRVMVGGERRGEGEWAASHFPCEVASDRLVDSGSRSSFSHSSSVSCLEGARDPLTIDVKRTSELRHKGRRKERRGLPSKERTSGGRRRRENATTPFRLVSHCLNAILFGRAHLQEI